MLKQCQHKWWAPEKQSWVVSGGVCVFRKFKKTKRTTGHYTVLPMSCLNKSQDTKGWLMFNTDTRRCFCQTSQVRNSTQTRPYRMLPVVSYITASKLCITLGQHGAELSLSSVLTLRLLRSEDQDGNLGGIWLTDFVSDSQLELVYPRWQIGHDNLVVEVGFL